MRKLGLTILLGAVAGAAVAQSWITAYEQGLTAVRATNWIEARTAFKQAVAFRTEDVSNATTLPGPISERRQWRNGAPYSPNFLAAYAGFKHAATLAGDERRTLLNEVATELETLIAKNQLSVESFFVLNRTLEELGNAEKRAALETKFQESQGKLSWRIDREGMTPEDVAAINPGQAQPNRPSTPPTQTNPGSTPPVTPPTGTGTMGNLAPAVGRVATVPNKFAIVIGNSESRIEGTALPFATEDAQQVREALIQHAGYAEGNVDLVINGTKDGIMQAAKALSERVTLGGTVLIYFVGVGANLDGKDYLAGVDAQVATDASMMASKMELYRIFMAREAKIFAFFQVARPISRGQYFGREVPLFGQISQMQATLPGGQLFSATRGGRAIGLFGAAFSDALADLRINQIPITEFGWKVFDRMRGGSTGIGSAQNCTLPVLVQLGTDSPF